jgi:purine-binding chemotaxis protein CheW
MIATILAGSKAVEGDLRLVEFAATGLRLAIPLDLVERVLGMVAISPLPGAPGVVLGVINLHGSVIPVADVGVRLGRPSPSHGPDSHLLLARTPRRRLGLAVEEVLGVFEVPARVITDVGLLSAGGPLAGAVGLPDGVVLIHDLEAFLSVDEERQLDHALQAVT